MSGEGQAIELPEAWGITNIHPDLWYMQFLLYFIHIIYIIIYIVRIVYNYVCNHMYIYIYVYTYIIEISNQYYLSISRIPDLESPDPQCREVKVPWLAMVKLINLVLRHWRSCLDPDFWNQRANSSSESGAVGYACLASWYIWWKLIDLPPPSTTSVLFFSGSQLEDLSWGFNQPQRWTQ